MIQHAFRDAALQEVSSKASVNSNLTSAVKDVGTMIAALYGAGIAASAAKYNLASNVSGNGGAAMIATMEDKTESAKIQKEQKDFIRADEKGLDKLFTKLSNQSTGEEEDIAIDTVWNMLHRENKKKLDNKLNLQMFAENSKAQDYNKRAEEEFGTTDDIKKAGYINMTGKMLNFSGTDDPDIGRGDDHRAIGAIFDEKYDNQTQYLKDYLDMGNIRITPETGGIELSKNPTKEQYETLRKYIDNFKGEVIIDYNEGKTENVPKYSIQYKRGMPSSYIIGEISNYYERGIKPIEIKGDEE